MAHPILSPSCWTSPFQSTAAFLCLTQAGQDKLTTRELGGVLTILAPLPTFHSSPGFVLQGLEFNFFHPVWQNLPNQTYHLTKSDIYRGLCTWASFPKRLYSHNRHTDTCGAHVILKYVPYRSDEFCSRSACFSTLILKEAWSYWIRRCCRV